MIERNAKKFFTKMMIKNKKRNNKVYYISSLGYILVSWCFLRARQISKKRRYNAKRMNTWTGRKRREIKRQERSVISSPPRGEKW